MPLFSPGFMLFSALRFSVTESIWRDCLPKSTLCKSFNCSQLWPFSGIILLDVFFLLFYCFTYLLNKDVYLPLIENFPLGSGTRLKVILIKLLLIWIIHLSSFDLRWCLVLLCKEVCTEYFCVRCLECPFKGWRSAAI